MMFLNFFGAIPLLLPNIVWNIISIIYIKMGEEHGYQFEMGWNQVLDSEHVFYKGNHTLEDEDKNHYLVRQ